MTAILSASELRATAPSIFATHPIDSVTSRYAFIRTADVIDLLSDTGLFPVRASQSRCRTEQGRDYVKHVVRFRQVEHIAPLVPGQEIPELVITNSHNRTSAYQIMAGIWRCVCSNQMCVMSTDFGSISVRHSGGEETRSRIIDATYQVIEETPRILQGIEQWKGITLTRPQQLAFAEAAAQIKPSPIKLAFLLTARRPEDATDSDARRSLWATSQVIHENLVKGGLKGVASTGRRITTRPIKAVDADIKTNRALWRLTEEMGRMMN